MLFLWWHIMTIFWLRHYLENVQLVLIRWQVYHQSKLEKFLKKQLPSS